MPRFWSEDHFVLGNFCNLEAVVVYFSFPCFFARRGGGGANEQDRGANCLHLRSQVDRHHLIERLRDRLGIGLRTPLGNLLDVLGVRDGSAEKCSLTKSELSGALRLDHFPQRFGLRPCGFWRGARGKQSGEKRHSVDRNDRAALIWRGNAQPEGHKSSQAVSDHDRMLELSLRMYLT